LPSPATRKLCSQDFPQKSFLQSQSEASKFAPFAWSVIERRAYGCAFIQDGRIYENPKRNITADSLWPLSEPTVDALAQQRDTGSAAKSLRRFSS
jgi:hypothetical protein